MLIAPYPLRAWINPDLHPIGCIGAIDDPDEINHILAAEDWLKQKGCTHAYGPMNGSTWESYRATLGPQKHATFLNEPTADPNPWRTLGYTEIARYASTLAKNKQQVSTSRHRGQELSSGGWKIKNLEEAGGLDKLFPQLHALTQESFAKAFAFTPSTLDDFVTRYTPLRALIDPRIVLTAWSPDNVLQGYCFCIPDLKNPYDKEFIVKTLAVHPMARKTGVGSWLVGHAHRVADEAGWTGGGIHALMWAGSHSQKITAHAGKKFREYALFKRILDAQ